MKSNAVWFTILTISPTTTVNDTNSIKLNLPYAVETNTTRGSYAVLKNMEKIFPVWKSLEKIFSGLLVWKKKKIPRLDILTYLVILFIEYWYNFTYIILNNIGSVFDLGRSYGNVRSGKSPENVWKRSWKSLEIYFQNCVRTLTTTKWNVEGQLLFHSLANRNNYEGTVELV